MDASGGSRYKVLIPTIRKKRSQMLRRPRVQANEFKLKKLKLKLAGAAHIIQTKNSSYGSSSSLLSSKSAQPSDPSQPRQNLTPQDNSSEDGPLADKKSGLKGNSCEDLPGGTVGASKSDMDEELLSVYKIGYPYGRAPALPRKQKAKLPEVEQQLKKAEAAQRRRVQNEKAAQESEAQATRKILGQDSNWKKQEELTQEKAANELAPNSIRVVMGPAGTTVTFSHGLPSIFDSKPCSYPPPREKCVGPSCVNKYKYRDSKTKLPLCGLKCYKAIHEKAQNES